MTVLGGLQLGFLIIDDGEISSFNTDDGIRRATMIYHEKRI